jgi:hypothetical protein
MSSRLRGQQRRKEGEVQLAIRRRVRYKFSSPEKAGPTTPAPTIDSGAVVRKGSTGTSPSTYSGGRTDGRRGGGEIPTITDSTTTPRGYEGASRSTSRCELETSATAQTDSSETGRVRRSSNTEVTASGHQQRGGARAALGSGKHPRQRAGFDMYASICTGRPKRPERKSITNAECCIIEMEDTGMGAD